MGYSAQLFTKESVLEAYSNAQITWWAIFEGKDLMFKGDSGEMLAELLDMLDNGVSSPTYRLCLYEEVKDRKQIKNKTDWDYSIKFKLQNDEVDRRRGEYSARRETRIDAIEKSQARIIALLENKSEEEDEEEEKPNKLGVIGDILNHPSVAPIIPMLAQNLIGLFFPQQQSAMQNEQFVQRPAAALGSVGEDVKISQALQILREKDAKLGDHLLQLASIAQDNAPLFNMLIQSLEANT